MRALWLGVLLAAPAPAATEPAKPTAEKDKLICQRETPVGSLIPSKKRCMSKAAWDRLAEDHGDFARKMVEDNMTRSAGK